MSYYQKGGRSGGNKRYNDRGYKRKYQHEEKPKEEERINQMIVTLGDENLIDSDPMVLELSKLLENDLKNHKSQIINLIVKW